MLFSGGTDSLCALVDAVTNGGARPVLVGHWAAKHVKPRQQRLRAAVRRAFGPWEFPLVQVRVPPRRQAGRARARSGRGASSSPAWARRSPPTSASRRVLLPDNGYVAINPPINDQLVGALASRGTHPKFLLLFNRLVGRVFGGRVAVSNPLWDKTRAEALALLAEAGGAELLRETYSCGKLQGRTAGKPHCGGCSQCVDRRFAVIRAGLEEHDPAGRYEVDLFAPALAEGEARVVALSYLRLAEELAPLEPEAILDRRRELDHCVDPDDPDFDTRSVALAAVLRRHAAEVLDAMATVYARHAREPCPSHRGAGFVGASLAGPRRDAALGRADPVGDPSAFGVRAERNRSRFERFGEGWFLEFRNEKGGLKDVVGTQRLARIVKAAGADLEALDLVAGSAAPSRTHAARRGKPEASRASRQGDAGTVLDGDAIKDYLKRRDELDRDIKVNEAAGKTKQAADLRRERHWIDRELKAWVGKHDEPRAFPEEHEHARQTVSKTVWEALRKLEHQTPTLAAHLETFVHLGYLCWYAPDPAEPWDVAL